jgi:hypothetical protein
LYWGGERFDQALRKYVDVLGWVMVVLIIAAYFYFKH